jgi:Bacterial self-protective colicin-like immunity
MDSFLSQSLSYPEFEKKYFDLWRQDRDEQWELVQPSGERPDLVLHEALNKGEITKEQFGLQWRKLFKCENEKNWRLAEILDGVFSDLDVCTDVPEEAWEINEQELRRRVEQAIKEIRSLRISDADGY